MIPKTFFETASSQDLQFIRRWTVGVSVLYSILAVAVVALSFIFHAPNGSTAAAGLPDVQHAVLDP
jgi:hypothetical protein